MNWLFLIFSILVPFNVGRQSADWKLSHVLIIGGILGSVAYLLCSLFWGWYNLSWSTLGILCISVSCLIVGRMFGMWMNQRRSAGGSLGPPPKRLYQIELELEPGDLEEWLLEDGETSFHKMKKSQEALLDYCEAQPGIQKVMSENRLTRDDLEQLYGELVEVGAGQWRGRHFVAASSIAYPHTLEHLVATWGDFDKKDSDKKRETSFKLLMHFERGIPLDVNVWDHL